MDGKEGRGRSSTAEMKGAALEIAKAPCAHARGRERRHHQPGQEPRSAGRARSPSLADLIGGRVVEGLVTSVGAPSPERCHPDRPSVPR